MIARRSQNELLKEANDVSCCANSEFANKRRYIETERAACLLKHSLLVYSKSNTTTYSNQAWTIPEYRTRFVRRHPREAKCVIEGRVIFPAPMTASLASANDSFQSGADMSLLNSTAAELMETDPLLIAVSDRTLLPADMAFWSNRDSYLTTTVFFFNRSQMALTHLRENLSFSHHKSC